MQQETAEGKGDSIWETPRDEGTLRGAKWGIMGAVIVAAVGGLVWVTYAFFAPSAQSPQTALADAFRRSATIASLDDDVQFAAEVNAEMPTSTPAARRALVAQNPYYSFLGAGGAQASILMDASGTLVSHPNGILDSDQRVSVNVDLSGNGANTSFAASGEMREIGNSAIYVFLKTFPNLGIINLSPFKGKWIEMPVNTLSANAGASISTTTLTSADTAKLTSAAEGMIGITKVFPDDTVGGVLSYHYGYDVLPGGVKNFMDTFIGIAAEKTASSSALDVASATAQANDQVDQMFKQISSMGGELWVGKSDHYFHQITLGIAAATTTSQGGAAMTVTGNLAVTSTISNIDGSQTVTAPAGAVTLQSLFGSISPIYPTGGGGSTGIAPPSAASGMMRGSVTLTAPSYLRFGTLGFSVSSVFPLQLTMTVTDTATGRSATVTLVEGTPQTVLGYTMTVEGITKLETKDALGHPEFYNQAVVSFVKQ